MREKLSIFVYAYVMGILSGLFYIVSFSFPPSEAGVSGVDAGFIFGRGTSYEDRRILQKGQVEPEWMPEPALVYTVTAYCSCEKCCGKWSDGYTASGHRIQPGDKFLAAPRSIPFGTRISIPGYARGRFVPVEDRGGAIINNRLDVFFDTHEEALAWGVQEYEVQ